MVLPFLGREEGLKNCEIRCYELLHWIPAEKGGGDVSMLQLSASEGRRGRGIDMVGGSRVCLQGVVMAPV